MNSIEDFNLTEMYGDFLQYIMDEIDGSEEIQHFGVKGMRWGVRKSEPGGTPELKSLGPDKITVTTKNGEKLDLVKDPTTGLHRVIGRLSKKYREDYSNHASLTIRKKDGTKVGEANVARRGKDDLYLNWLGIDRKQRGKGYATAVMKAAEKFGKQEGFKKMTLEVPGNSPDARHIYTKLGFKVTKEADPKDKDDIWGGLTEMEYTFKHSSFASNPTEDFLEHFGVKGMRWGVRNSEPGSRQQRKAEKAEKKWDRRAKQGFFSDYAAASKMVNRVDIPRINNKPQYKNADFRRTSPLREKYYKEMNDALAARMTEAAKARVGDSPLGRREVKYKYNKEEDDIFFHITEAKHDSLEDFFFRGKLDSMGRIISIEVVEEETLQQSDASSDFLEHYGVKGMRWGVRTADRPAASSDAIAFRGVKTKAKKGGVQALSNKELKEFNERANLEQQYHRLNPSAKKKALQFTADILLGVGKQQAMKLAGDVAAKQIANLLKK